MCLLDGSRDVAVPIIAADQKLDHFNPLWCHLYNAISSAKGLNFLQILPAKQLSISTLFDRVFPPIASTKNQPTPFITPKTVAYIFGLIIDSVTVHHAESPHARALEYEATILEVLESMPAHDFRSELRSALISYYDGILKIPGAVGRPEAKVFKRAFNARRSVDPPACAAAAAAPPPDDPAGPAPPPADPAPPPAAAEGEDPERTPPPADRRSPAAASPAVAAAAAGGKGRAGLGRWRVACGGWAWRLRSQQCGKRRGSLARRAACGAGYAAVRWPAAARGSLG